MVNAMLSKSSLSEGFWGEAMLTSCYILNRVLNKRNSITPYDLWNKRMPNLSHFRVWGCRAIVKIPEPKKRKLGERGIECIFIGYAEYSKAYRFMVIEPNESITVNTVIESRDAIFDETRFSSIPKPNSPIPTTMTPNDNQRHGDIVEVRRSKRIRKEKFSGPDFFFYLIEGTGDSIENEITYVYSIDLDPISFKEAMDSQDAPFWKEAVQDEMDSIMENNTWVLVDLPPGCEPITSKWIFKRKKRVDGTIERFKARLVIRDFNQRHGIDYFDTYALIARITTITVLIALTAIQKLSPNRCENDIFKC